MEDKLDKLMIAEECKANKDDNTYTIVGSIEKTDRDRDVLKVAGIDLKNYKKNSVVLWAHNNRELPIGKTERVWKKDGKLMFKIKFASAEHNPIAPFVEQQFKDGFLNAFSISFIPNYETVSYDEKKGIRFINNSELLELSAVPIPANPDAVMVRELEARVEKAGLKEYFPEIKEEVDRDETIAKLEGKIAELELALAEKELEEETEDDIYTQLYDEYSGALGRNCDHTDDQTDDTLGIDDLF